jgi:predicted nucleotidyltransferase
LAHGRAGLRLLLVFGSRARGDARDGSDWDLGYLGDAELDATELLADVVEVVGTERVDLVDLARAGAQLRYRAAAEGEALYSADGAFERFWIAAVSFWCDAGPVIRAGYGDVLSRLRR